VLLLIGLTVLLASIASPYFLTWLNLKNVLISCSVELMIAAGMSLVMISGGIDLSVGSIMGVAAIAAAMLFDADVPALAVAAAALGIGVGAGLLNGTLIAYAGLNPLVTTLATMTIWRSAVYILSGGYALSSIPAPFKEAFSAELLGLPRLVPLHSGFDRLAPEAVRSGKGCFQAERCSGRGFGKDIPRSRQDPKILGRDDAEVV